MPEGVRDEIRKKAIKLLIEGKSQQELAKHLNEHDNSLCRWWKKYRSEGISEVKARKRGVSSEQKKILSSAQGRGVQKMIFDKIPDQLNLPNGLWTRKAVVELIQQEFGVELAVRTMGDYLQKWGYTPQKPAKRAYEQSAPQVKQWVEEQYPQIKQRAIEENAEIHWGDETGIRNDCQHGRSYSPKGKTPVRKLQAKRITLNMISSITNQGKVRFMIYRDTMNSKRFISFLKRLIQGSERKIFLIVDNLKVHHSKPVHEWVAQNSDEIELFYLPSYSPERNPDEYLNGDMKRSISNKPAPKNAGQLEKNVRSHLKLLQRNPNRAKSYFQHENIKYAS